MGDLKSELLKIRAEHGFVNPRVAFDVVRADRAAWPALDGVVGEFWDNKDAAWEWACTERIRQAMNRAMGVTYSQDSGQRSLADYRGRSWFAIKSERGQPKWEPVEAVVSNPMLRKVVFAEMQREIDALVARYQHLEEFAPAMARALKRMEKSTG